MGMAYAATIQDLKMFRTAFFTELVSLLACVVIGVIVSVSMGPFSISETLPTDEQLNRGTLQSLYIGMPVAFFSGLGVAVSVLDEQTSSLVGVAISASLLPPAVNAGMLWTAHLFNEDEGEADTYYYIDGVRSLVLTIVNIVMIIISSMIMFRLKEVRFVYYECREGVLKMQPFCGFDTISSQYAPTSTSPYFQRMKIKRKKIFWTDLGLARKIYRNLAVFPTAEETAAVTNGVRRVGRRVSLLVHAPFASNTDNHSRHGDQNDASNDARSDACSDHNMADSDERQHRIDSNTLDVPRGSEDFTTAPKLSTVLEERLSGVSEYNKSSDP